MPIDFCWLCGAWKGNEVLVTFAKGGESIQVCKNRSKCLSYLKQKKRIVEDIRFTSRPISSTEEESPPPPYTDRRTLSAGGD